MEKPKLRTVFDVSMSEVRGMTHEESKAFVTLYMAGKKDPSPVVKGKDLEAAFRTRYKVEAGTELPFQLAVGFKRLAACDPEGEFDVDMAYFAFGILADRVGLVVLWAYSLSKGRVRVNGQAISLDNWSTQLHPNGPPTNDTLFEIWDAQKGYKLGLKCDNYLDQAEAWE